MTAKSKQVTSLKDSLSRQEDLERILTFDLEVSLTFDLPKQTVEMAHLLITENNCAKLCRSCTLVNDGQKLEWTDARQTDKQCQINILSAYWQGRTIQKSKFR